jgi:Flp pilus assembly protein TadD
MRSTMSRNGTDSKKQTPASEEKTALAAHPPVKKSFLWMWVSVGLLILFCLAVVGLAVRNRLSRSVVPAPASISMSVEETPENTPLQAPANGVPAQQPPIVQNPSPELSVAIDLVAGNPQDPDAHLTLSLALWDANEVRPALDELMQAADLAGSNNRSFLSNAAEKFMQREAWLPAATLYLRLASNDKNMSPKLLNNFHESVYKASEQDDAKFMTFFDRVDAVDKALGHIARGRQLLFEGNLEDAKKQAVAADKINPGMPELRMLNAEIAMKVNNQEEARKIMLALSSASETPEWIRVMAENYLKLIQ